MDSPELNETPQPQMPDTTPYDAAPPAPKPKRRWWLWAVIGAWLLGMLACGLCVMASLPAMQAGMESDEMVTTLNAFFEALDQQDLAEAASLVSTRGAKFITEEALSEMIEGANYSIFEDFESVTINNMMVRTGVNTNPNMPNGVYSQISGSVDYTGGYTGSFSAVLERENDEWRVFSFNMTAPPEKIQNSGDN